MEKRSTGTETKRSLRRESKPHAFGGQKDRPGGERGVSEVIGYTILFAVVLGATVIGALVGIEVLATAGEPTTGEVGVQTFEEFDSEVAELTDGAPYRKASVEPRDATFSYGATYTINITASGGGVDLTGSNAVEFSSVELQQRVGEKTNVTYASGLIAREQDDGVRALAASSPNFRVSTRQAVFTLPLTFQKARTSNYVSPGNDARFTILTERVDSSVVQQVGLDASNDPIEMDGTIRINGSSVPTAWKAYFEDEDAFSPAQLDSSGGKEYAADTDGDGEIDTVGAEFTSKRLYVQAVDVAVGLGETL